MVGVAAYVGKDTRIMRNLIIGKQKKSDLELTLQWQILFVFCVQLVFASTAAFYTVFWEKENQDSTNVYLQFYPEQQDMPPWSAGKGAKVWIRSFFTWILLFTNFVPISLLVTMEVIKFFQAQMMSNDY